MRFATRTSPLQAPPSALAARRPGPRAARGSAGSRRLLVVLVAASLAGCATGDVEMELSKDTFACKLQGQRFIVRFTEQEARILMPPDGRMVNLYQVTTGAGVRYTNGMMELRGSGSDLTLIRDNFAVALTDCEPLKVPKKSGNPFGLS